MELEYELTKPNPRGHNQTSRGSGSGSVSCPQRGHQVGHLIFGEDSENLATTTNFDVDADTEGTASRADLSSTLLQGYPNWELRESCGSDTLDGDGLIAELRRRRVAYHFPNCFRGSAECVCPLRGPSRSVSTSPLQAGLA